MGAAVSRSFHHLEVGGSVYTKEIGTSSHLGSLFPRATLLDGQDQEEPEPLRSCPRLLRGPFICFTNTVLYRSQIIRLLSHRTKVTPTQSYCPLSLRSTAKVGQNLFGGTDIKVERSRHLEPVGGPTLLRPRRSGFSCQSPMGSHRALVRAARSSSSGPAPSASWSQARGQPPSTHTGFRFPAEAHSTNWDPWHGDRGISVSSGLFDKQLLPWQHGYY